MRTAIFCVLTLSFGCSKTDPPPKKAPAPVAPIQKVEAPAPVEEPKKSAWQSSSVWTGVPAYLVRTKTKTDRFVAATLWKNLPAEMAKDPETMKLLREMLKAEKLTLATHEKLETDFRPEEPKEAGEAYLAIGPSKVRTEKGTGSEVYTLYLNNGLFVAGPTRSWPEGFSEVKLVIWAINDFLLRHDRGYILEHGIFSPFDTDSETHVAKIEAKEPEQLRKELDAKMEKVKSAKGN